MDPPARRLAFHPPFMSSSVRTTLAFLAFLAVAGFFLLTEHRAHTLGALPFLVILACPLIHLFHGHGGHGDASGRDSKHRMDDRDSSPDSSTPHQHGR